MAKQPDHPIKPDYSGARQLAQAANLELTEEQRRELGLRLAFIREWYAMRRKSRTNRAHRTTTAELRKRLAAAKKAVPALDRLIDNAPLRLLLRDHGADLRTIPPLVAAILAAEVPGSEPRRGRGGARHFGNVPAREAVELLDEAFTTVTGRTGKASFNSLSGKAAPFVLFVREGLFVIENRYRSEDAVHKLIKSVRKDNTPSSGS